LAVTEEEWKTTSDLYKMLEWSGALITDRKRCLLLLQCCRTYPEEVRSEISHLLVEAEKFIEGCLAPDMANSCAGEASRIKEQQVECQDFDKAVVSRMAQFIFKLPSNPLHGYLYCHTSELQWPDCERTKEKQLCDILREIFNPFALLSLDPRWLTSSVVDVAEAIYQEKAFDRMPILADALMDAGCDSEEVLGHCRSEGPHVRGCWVVDLLTGRM
jgi:hypothetical protein